jgi:hypothetical protein
MRNNNHIKYPHRNAHFCEETGVKGERVVKVLRAGDQPYSKWFRTRAGLYQLLAAPHVLQVESLQEFKARFGL